MLLMIAKRWVVSCVTMPDCDGDKTYWSSLAHAYAAMGPPLRPASADIAYMEGAVAAYAARHPQRPMRAVLLGVTPQIAGMRWPPRASLLAADNSFPMVQAVWPRNLPGSRVVVCADWSALPIPDSGCDVVVGDGSLSCVRYPHGIRAVAAEARRILRANGTLMVRCYIRPREQERPQDVVADLLRGDIPSFHGFKLRLLMALQESTERGVSVDAVYRFWASQRIDETALIAQTGWDAKAVRTMELYRGKDTVHSFPTLAELRSVLAAFFEETAISTPAQTTEGCCPIWVAAPRADARPAAVALGAAACSR